LAAGNGSALPRAVLDAVLQMLTSRRRPSNKSGRLTRVCSCQLGFAALGT
jgi:hypothetical protein